MIETLIESPDGFEIIRDKILSILATEIANQQILAVAAGKDPALWALKIYSERANPWEQWINDQSDLTPICNVWYDNTAYPMSGGDVVGRQKNEAVYNLDLYACGVSAATQTGQAPGDKEAAYTVHRALRLVRNILMAGEYTYLGYRGTVGRRWIDSITVFQPEFEGRVIQQIAGARVAFRVEFNDFSPQYVPSVIEYIATTIRRAEDGQIIARLDVDFTV